jgi:hypothetical protein
MKIGTSKTLSALALATLWASTVSAEPISMNGQNEADWRYTLALYAFLPARTTGTSTIAGSEVPLDMDLGDAVELLDWASSGRFEAWKGDLGIIVDANYVSLGLDGTLPSPTPADIAFDVSIRQKWISILAAYKVVDGTYGENNRRFAIDLQGGARYNKLRQEVTITAPAPPGGSTVLGGDDGWWEPVIGVRGMWVLNDTWAAIASLDLGGFGAGGNDLQVGANVGFDWRAWDKTSVFFGYRYYSMDYSNILADGAFEYDVQQHGPVVGVKFRF